MDLLLAIALLAMLFVAVGFVTSPRRLQPTIMRLADVGARDRDPITRRGGFIEHEKRTRSVRRVRSIVFTDAPACEVRFAQPLPVPLRIQRRTHADADVLSVSSGVHSFDERFVVCSPFPELAAQILTPELCYALLDYARSPLVLDERGLRIRLPGPTRLALALPELAEQLSSLASAVEGVHTPRARLLDDIARTRARIAALPPDLSFLPEPGLDLPPHLEHAAEAARIDLDEPFVAQLSHALEDGSLLLHLELRQLRDTRWNKLRWVAPVHTLGVAVLTLPELAQVDAERLEEHEMMALLAAVRGRLLTFGDENWGLQWS